MIPSRKKIAGALVLLVLIVAVGYVQLFPDKANETQTGEEGGKPIVSVKVPDLSIPAEMGKLAFDKNCASCHGENAAGREGKAPPLVHRFYEPNHHGDLAIVRAAKRGVQGHHWPFGNMPPVKTVTDAELQNIIIYLRELQRANGIL